MSDQPKPTTGEWWRSSYEEIKGEETIKNCDGAQMFNGKWWMPLFGCDTLDHLNDAHDAELAEEREKVQRLVDALKLAKESCPIAYTHDIIDAALAKAGKQ